MTETELQGNAQVSASLPLEVFLWLLRKCQESDMTRSAMVAKIIGEAKEQEDDIKGTIA